VAGLRRHDTDRQNRYEGFGWDLTLIDTGHWLGVLLLIGAVIGWFGAPGVGG
jgi:hypothetical protein